MSFTKRQFIDDAYGELGMASYIFDLEPETIQRALRRLDSMMADWNGRGIRLGYPISGSPADSDLDELTSVPDRANKAVILNLAIELAPGHGKTVSPQTLAAAKRALDTVMAWSAMPPEVQLTNIPRGAGAKNTTSPFFPGPTDPLTAGPDSELEFQ